MKKYMILFLLNFIIINSDTSYQTIFNSKCEDIKAKSGACRYTLVDSKGNVEYALFDKCGNGKKCGENGVCEEGLKLRKYKESCNYDEDCVTGSCKNNKCEVAKENDECEDIICGPGLGCIYQSNNVYKCVKLANENSKPGTNTKCMAGFKTDKEGKCTKLGSFEDGYELESGNRLLCHSGLSHLSTAKSKIICDSLESEPECKDGVIIKNGSWKDGTTIERGNCQKGTDYKGTDKEYYGYSKLQSKFYGEFLDEYNKLNLDKINSDDKYLSSENENLFSLNKLNKKAYEKYQLYENAPALQAAGLIDSEGKVVDDKKCEYDYFIKYLNSGFIKLKTIFIAMIILLF